MVPKEKEGSKRPENIVEAALFSAGRPMSIEEITEATGLPQGPIRRSLKRLIKTYGSKGTSIEVAKAGTRYTMQLKTAYAEAAVNVASCEIPRRVLKTLALIAYHQPIKQSELKTMIGDKIYDHVKELRSLGMIFTRRYGQTKILMTSKRFPEYFGIGTASREGIKKWIAEKVGIKVVKSKIPMKHFKDIEAELEAEAAACADEGTLPKNDSDKAEEE